MLVYNAGVGDTGPRQYEREGADTMGDGHLLRKNVALALQCTHNRSQVRIHLLKQAPPLLAKNNELGCAMLIKLRAAEELCFEIH